MTLGRERGTTTGARPYPSSPFGLSHLCAFSSCFNLWSYHPNHLRMLCVVMPMLSISRSHEKILADRLRLVDDFSKLQIKPQPARARCNTQHTEKGSQMTESKGTTCRWQDLAETSGPAEASQQVDDECLLSLLHDSPFAFSASVLIR